MSDTDWKYGFYRSLWIGLDFIFPPACGGCGKAGNRWCDDCQKNVKCLTGILCDVCGLPQSQAGICSTCRVDRPHFHALRAWAVFEDPLRNALHKLKYRRDLSMGDSIASQMISFVKNLSWPVDAIVPIPLGKKRLGERGYNQVGMVAWPLALALGLEYMPAGLARWKETRSQVGLTRSERRDNVHEAFVAGGRVKGKAILVMDDVSTTGATLSSGAQALISAGAKKVYALTVARALKLESA